MPVLGEVQIPVNINNHQVDVTFLVADIAGNEVVLGQLFSTQAAAHLISVGITLSFLVRKCPTTKLKAA